MCDARQRSALATQALNIGPPVRLEPRGGPSAARRHQFLVDAIERLAQRDHLRGELRVRRMASRRWSYASSVSHHFPHFFWPRTPHGIQRIQQR